MATIIEKERKGDKKVYLIQASVQNVGAGKRIRKSKTVVLSAKLSPRQLEKELQKISAEFEQETKKLYGAAKYEYGSPDITFEEFSYKWLERIKREKSASHYANSKDALEDINPLIGGYKLKDITPSILQYAYDQIDQKEREIVKVVANSKFFSYIQQFKIPRCRLAALIGISDSILCAMKNGQAIKLKGAQMFAEYAGKDVNYYFDITVTKQKYSYESIRKRKVTVQGILTYAKKLRLVEHNFATREYLDFPERIKNIPEHLSEENSLAFYRFLMEYPDIKMKTMGLIILLTGIRRGELCGLELSDLDLKKEIMTIRRSKVVVTGFGIIEKEPKNQTSVRVFRLPKILVNVLEVYLRWYWNKRNELGDAWKAGTKLLVSDMGTAIYPQTANIWLRKILEESGLPKVTLRSLRHTNITLQLMENVPLMTVSKRAGHARPSTTSDIYAYCFQSRDAMAANVLDNIFS
ncbi:MAG: site-specific integrase [Clostridiales bacterium]|nr:site-specific integrase [Clostridiales bacterium]